MLSGTKGSGRSRGVRLQARVTTACAAAVAVLIVALTALSGPASARSAGNRSHPRHKRSGPAAKGERKLSAGIVIKLTPPSEKMPQTNEINLFVPQGFRDAGVTMPKCSPTSLKAKGPKGCPKKTVVGSGTSIGYTILGGDYVVEHLKLTMFNGPGGDLLTYVEGKTPVEIEEIVTGLISAPKGFGREFAFAIPHGLLEPLPQAPGWLQTLNAHLSGRVGWLRTTSCPPHPWHLKAELGYTNGEGVSIETELACQ